MYKRLTFILLFLLPIIGVSAVPGKPAVAKVSSYLTGIVNMKVKQGQYVKKGDLLFTISTDYLNTVIGKCKNSVWYNKETYKRIRKLQNKRTESLENRQKAKYDLEKAISRLKQEEVLENKWSKYYAPFDGVVTKIYYFTGSTCPDGTCGNNNSVLEITKTSDKNIETGPVIANIAPYLSGIVETKLLVGDKVKKGDVLFKINMDCKLLDKKKYQAAIKFWKEKYKRDKGLHANNNTVSLKLLQNSIYNYVNAEQDLKATNVIINKRSVYRAPFDGTVTDIIHYTGSNAFPGHTVMKIKKTD
ncbi:MAG: biotin/lipoyl-binding protein [Victivallales bacterium]|nr:biotin/lipoyl-binding protein [Victivallales bacterium]